METQIYSLPYSSVPRVTNIFNKSLELLVHCISRTFPNFVSQVAILLLTADWLVHWMWKQGKDPDNYSIPYLTALGDLLGTGLLAVSFHLLWLVGDRDADVGD